MERSNGAVKTDFDIQVNEKRGPGEAQNDLEADDRERSQRAEALSYRPS